MSATIESAAAWLKGLGYATRFGPGKPGAERADYGQALLLGRVRSAQAELHRGVPGAALDEALRKVTQPRHPSLFRSLPG